MNKNVTKRIGIVGFGSLGQYLYKSIKEDAYAKDKFEICFIWNRSTDKLNQIPKDLILDKLEDFHTRKADLIVEVCHPQIIKEYGEKFLQYADLFVGSPTAFADSALELKLRNAASKGNYGVYIPSGALWGAEDIEKMAVSGTLGKLQIAMKKHPNSLKVEEPLLSKLKEYQNDSQKVGEFIVYEGSVRELCPLAPNNVNTMATASLAAFNLGFDNVKALLIADKSLQAHVIEIIVEGPRKEPDEEVFKVNTVRYNPAKPGAVTGNQTYNSFFMSLLRASNSIY